MINPGQKTRVLMTADAVGGIWTYSLELAAAAADHECEFTLAVMGRPPSAAQRRTAESIPNLRLVCGDFTLEWMDDPWDDVDAAGEWLLSLCQELQPDVVHLNHYAFGRLDFPAPILLAAHSCILSWWNAVRRESAPSQYDEYRRRTAAGLAAADLVVAPTQAMLSQLANHYGEMTDTRIVHNGRSVTGLTPRPKDPVVVAAGRLWDEAKNIALLNEIAPSLPWPCLIAGELRHPNGGRSALKNCTTLGHLGEVDMGALLSRTAIFAHPVRYEPFGLAPLEAALAGCALVLGDIPSMRELWEGAASFVDPDDPDTLRLALDELINRPARRARAAAAAWQRAAIYSPERFGAGYAAIYSDLRERAKETRAQPAGARQH